MLRSKCNKHPTTTAPTCTLRHRESSALGAEQLAARITVELSAEQNVVQSALQRSAAQRQAAQRSVKAALGGVALRLRITLQRRFPCARTRWLNL